MHLAPHELAEMAMAGLEVVDPLPDTRTLPVRLEIRLKALAQERFTASSSTTWMRPLAAATWGSLDMALDIAYHVPQVFPDTRAIPLAPSAYRIAT